MAGLLSAVGGALAGFGQGLTAQAEEDGKAKREARLMELQHGYRMSEMGAQQSFQAGESEKDRSFRSGESEKDRTFRSGESEKDRTFRAGESGADRAFRAGESEKDRAYRMGEADKSRSWERERLNISNDQQGDRDRRLHDFKLEETDRSADAKARARMSMFGNTSGLNPDDRRQFAALDKLYGDEPEAMRQALVASGNPRLESLAKTGGQGGDSGRKKAEMSADDKRLYDAVVERHTDQMLKKTNWDGVARDLRGLQRNDLASFAVDQPDPSKWQRVDIPQDLQQPRAGTGSRSPTAAQAASAPTAPAPAAQPQPPQQPAAQPSASAASNPPAGKGTQAEPYQAASQADIEWFKASAPKGAVIVVNGKPFTK